MTDYNQVIDILHESDESDKSQDELKIDKIQTKADRIRAKAELMRANNQIKKAKLDAEKLDGEVEKHEEENEKKAATQYPRESVDLDSGDPIHEIYDLSIDEDIIRDLDTDTSLNEVDEDEDEDEDISKLPDDAQDEEEEDEEQYDEIDVVVAGEDPQNKDEAEIARIQAQTREIQAKIGEYSPSGAEGQGEMGEEDPQAMGEQDPAGLNDPSAGEIDPMTGMPVQPEKEDDPMEGFGDTTDPNSDPMGMMGGGAIDPMTGMPSEDDEGGKTPTALGKLYQMKKLYYRLAILDKILTSSPDKEIEELARTTSEAFALFRMIIQNLKSYKDKADEIIVSYYQLVKDISDSVEKHLKEKALFSES